MSDERHSVAEDAGDEADTALPEAEVEADAEVEVLAVPAPPRDKRVLAVLAAGLVVVLALGALVGWLGYREYQLRGEDALRQTYLEAGRRAAVNLTSIDHRHVDDDVKRVLDSSTGKFFDDFQRRAPSFSDVVKQMQSAAVGTVTEAGVEKATSTEGLVLVAVTVHTEVGNGPPQPDRAWRIRLSMLKVADGAKVSNVEFVQ